ncbi:MAG: N-acetylneuraminate synthase family protein [Cellvibrionaceae bacterium]
MKETIKILNKEVGRGQPCFIIAEVAQAHDGSLGIAHSYIDAVAEAGADAIKFQTHIASAESSVGEPFRVKFSYEDNSRYDYWKRMEFTEEQWRGLAEHCNEVGLIFLSSPFSSEALRLLNKIGMPAWKVGSGEVNNPILLRDMIDTGNPILLSSGMNTWSEIEQAVSSINKMGGALALFQCTSKYPTAFGDVGLNVIDQMRKKFHIPIGLSDHSGSTVPSLAAISRGINLLEVHVVFDRKMFGPDSSASITLNELKSLVEFRDGLHLIEQSPVDKDDMAKELSEMRALFNKSIVLSESIKEGNALTKEILTLRKPGTGILAEKLNECIGKKVNKDLDKGQFLTWKDFE